MIEELKVGDQINVWGFCSCASCGGHKGERHQIVKFERGLIGINCEFSAYSKSHVYRVHPRQCEKVREPREAICTIEQVTRPNGHTDVGFIPRLHDAWKIGETVRVREVIE